MLFIVRLMVYTCISFFDVYCLYKYELQTQPLLFFLQLSSLFLPLGYIILQYSTKCNYGCFYKSEKWCNFVKRIEAIILITKTKMFCL